MTNKIRFIAFIAVVFCAGFLTHAFFFPDFLPSVKEISAGKIKSAETQTDAEGNMGLFTYVNYDGVNFSPRVVTIHRGSYIAITNRSSNKLMWLMSDNESLNTKRGYGLSERLERILEQPGTYTVTEKSDANANLTVIVK